MKKALFISCFLLGVSGSYAAVTDLNTKWVCTTNASSSDAAMDKTADAQMANTADSAANAFAYSAKNCRDCTKITCEVQS